MVSEIAALEEEKENLARGVVMAQERFVVVLYSIRRCTYDSTSCHTIVAAMPLLTNQARQVLAVQHARVLLDHDSQCLLRISCTMLARPSSHVFILLYEKGSPRRGTGKSRDISSWVPRRFFFLGHWAPRRREWLRVLKTTLPKYTWLKDIVGV